MSLIRFIRHAAQITAVDDIKSAAQKTFKVKMDEKNFITLYSSAGISIKSSL